MVAPKIIYEDEKRLVVDKPAGWVTTKENAVGKTVEDWLEGRVKKGLERNGIVHRLDKGTSGLLLVAKDTEELQKMKLIFKQRKIKKFYLALVGGDLPKDGAIKVPVGRSKFGFGKFGVGVEGKPAETRFWLINKYKREGKIYSLIKIQLMTGRTHQIRVHFSYLKWPLLGDVLYGGERGVVITRPFLAAVRIEFEDKIFEADMADDLKKEMTFYEKI